MASFEMRDLVIAHDAEKPSVPKHQHTQKLHRIHSNGYPAKICSPSIGASTVSVYNSAVNVVQLCAALTGVIFMVSR